MIAHLSVDKAEVHYDKTDNKRPITVVLSDINGNVFRGFLSLNIVNRFGTELLQAGQRLEKPKKPTTTLFTGRKPKAGTPKPNKGRQRTRIQNR